MKKIYKQPLVEIHHIDAVHVIAESTLTIGGNASELGSGEIQADVREQGDWDIW